MTSVSLEKDTCLNARALRCFRPSSEVLRFIDGAVTAEVPLHPPEEVDHGALRQQAAQDGAEGELARAVQCHCGGRRLVSSSELTSATSSLLSDV